MRTQHAASRQSTKRRGLPHWRPLLSVAVSRLTLLDSTGGAGASAGTAANASVLVDFVDVAFADSSDGALIDAGAASNTDVSDFVSHSVFVF